MTGPDQKHVLIRTEPLFIPYGMSAVFVTVFHLAAMTNLSTKVHTAKRD